MFLKDKKWNSFLKKFAPVNSDYHLLAGTIVLAVILGLCLLAAQVVVMARSGPSIAQENAVELIKDVSRRGVTNFFDPNAVINYYLQEESGRTIGFAAMSYKPVIRQDGARFLAGRQLYYDETRKSSVSFSFAVSDDLSNYTYLEGSRRIMIPRQTLGLDNYVPAPLLDFFSSLAAKKAYKDGAVFTIDQVNRSRVSRQLFHLLECRVAPGGVVPEQVTQSVPEGKVVTVRLIGLPMVQTVYYNQNNQLIWQENALDSIRTTMISVPRQQLMDLFPWLDEKLDEWLEVTPDVEE